VTRSLVPIVLAGPTASGKSGQALALAERLDGEIVCADSRQVYEAMRIGTASPDDDELDRVPHVGFNRVRPEESYDAGRFLEDTDRAVAEVAGRGRVPILVGGSGLYLRSWRFGLDDVPPRDDELRRRLEGEVEALGTEALHARLAELDPASAERIKPQDPVRIIRALEVHALTGRSASELRRSHGEGPPRVDARWLLLEAEQPWLRARLEARAREMFANGLVAEAVALRERLGAGHRLVATMGYEEALQVADGETPEVEAVAKTAQRQARYARRQRTWFKKEPWWRRFDAAAPDLAEQLRAELEGAAS
jgi:tRNA dimethylallyltransferase